MATIKKQGPNYKITVYAGRDPITGKYNRRCKTFKPDPGKTEAQNRRAAESEAALFEAVIKNKPLSGSLTFTQVTALWLKEYAAGLEAQTVKTYINLLKVHILPALGGFKVDKITPLMISKFLNRLSRSRKDGKKGGYSAKTLKHVKNLLSGIFSRAVLWGMCSDNPVSAAETAQTARKPARLKYFTPEEARRFLGALDAPFISTRKAHTSHNAAGGSWNVAEYSQAHYIPLQLKLFFYMAAYTGARRSELIALTWNDITGNIVNINKSAALGTRSGVKDPKTEAGFRSVTVPEVVEDLIKEWEKEYKEYRAALGSRWAGDNWIFIQASGARMRPETPYKAFKKIIARYNADPDREAAPLPDIPLHGLRHTSATLLIASGVNIPTVSARLGHAKPSITLDIYAHALKEKDAVAAAALADMLT